MGLNEFAGYFAVGIVAFLTGWVAEQYGVTPYPFYIGVGISVLGLLVSWIWVQDTRVFVQKESTTDSTAVMENVFLETTFKNKNTQFGNSGWSDQ